MATCSNGHTSSASDYCDVCGDPIASTGAASATAGSAATPVSPAPPTSTSAPVAAASGSATTAFVACPSCNAENAGAALFCEDCGYDFTTGQMPTSHSGSGAPNSLSIDPALAAPTSPSTSAASAAASAGAGTGWVAEVWVDPDWFNLHGVNLGDPCPSATTPKVVVLREPLVTIGRTSRSRGITPTIDCGTDSAVSHKHASLTLDGDRWFIEDSGSTNGTYVSVAGSPLPETPMSPSTSRELAANERIQLGAWTRIVIRNALPGE